MKFHKKKSSSSGSLRISQAQHCLRNFTKDTIGNYCTVSFKYSSKRFFFEISPRISLEGLLLIYSESPPGISWERFMGIPPGILLGFFWRLLHKLFQKFLYEFVQIFFHKLSDIIIEDIPNYSMSNLLLRLNNYFNSKKTKTT